MIYSKVRVTTASIERDCEVLGHEIKGVEQLLDGIKAPEILLKRFEKMK